MDGVLPGIGLRLTSDHWPVGLSFGSLMWGSCSFRFENMLLSHPSFKTSLASWNVRVDGRCEGFCFLGMLRSLKGVLKDWNLSVFDLRREVRDCGKVKDS